MTSLVPVLHQLVAQADALFAEGRLPAARRAWEDLVQRAQDRVDRGAETAARAMLARCLLGLHEVEAAREHLARAGALADPGNVDGYARYRAALARLAIEDGPGPIARREIAEYLRWAEQERRGDEILDACLLLVPSSEPPERVEWLDRGLAQAVELGARSLELGRAWTEFAAALDQTGEAERALEAYQQALAWYEARGRPRDAVSAGWAVGALAARLEDWPLARTALERAIGTAERRTDCDDLVSLALADLAQVYEAAGDVIEARRLLLRALALAREQDLASAWPERWDGMTAHARRLEL